MLEAIAWILLGAWIGRKLTQPRKNDWEDVPADELKALTEVPEDFR